MMPLWVGMRFNTWAAFDGLPNRAVVLDANESPWTGEECGFLRVWEEGDERLFPMHLIYIPRDWEGPVEGPEDAVGGTESAGGQVVADGPECAFTRSGFAHLPHRHDTVDRVVLRVECPGLEYGTGTPTQEGYQQMMRQKSMAAHPAGSGLRSTADVPAGKARG